MDRENDVAGLLVSNYGLPLKYFHLAIEWQRERGGSLLDILVQMRATTPEQIESADADIRAMVDKTRAGRRRQQFARGTQGVEPTLGAVSSTTGADE